MEPKLCDRCYQPLSEGEHGLNVCRYLKRRDVLPSKGFEPRFDVALGRYVTGWGDVRKGMREEHLDFRDHPSPGVLSERRDRNNEKRKIDIEQGKGRRHW